MYIYIYIYPQEKTHLSSFSIHISSKSLKLGPAASRKMRRAKLALCRLRAPQKGVAHVKATNAGWSGGPFLVRVGNGKEAVFEKDQQKSSNATSV